MNEIENKQNDYNSLLLQSVSLIEKRDLKLRQTVALLPCSEKLLQRVAVLTKGGNLLLYKKSLPIKTEKLSINCPINSNLHYKLHYNCTINGELHYKLQDICKINPNLQDKLQDICKIKLPEGSKKTGHWEVITGGGE